MPTKSEIRQLYSLSSGEKKSAEKIFRSVNPSRRIEYIDLLVANGFNAQKIRAVSHETSLRFNKKKGGC